MKNIVAFVFLMMMAIPSFVMIPQVSAQDFGMNHIENGDLGLTQNADPRDVAVRVIKVMMTFLGIIAVVIILLGGFKWMTASGAEDKVEEAKNLIVAGIIGMVIILSAFAIVNWVFNTATTELLNS